MMKAAISLGTLLLVLGACADDDAQRAVPRSEPSADRDGGAAADGGSVRDAAADGGVRFGPAADSGGRTDAAAGRGSGGAAAADGGGGDRTLAELEACEDADCRAEPVCDGSDEIRLAYTRGGGGPVMSDYSFRYPFGYAFLVIDGSCHYYANAEADVGTVEGKLSDADALRLSKDMQLAKLARWNGSYGGCPDAPTATVLTQTAQISASCHRDAAPQAAAEVLARAEGWLGELSQRGAELAGPLRALAKREEALSASTPTYDWPIAKPLAETDGLVFVPSFNDETHAGARFDGADANALRELRSRANAALKDARAKGLKPLSPVVKDGGNGDAYLLYMRDELPPAQEKAFRRFLKWKR